MAQTQEVRGVATTVYHDEHDDMMKVIYHGTVVVAWDNTNIILNTGGWFTATTKNRMNQASNQYRLGYGVYQKAGEWFVDFKGETIKFEGHNLTLVR